MKNNGLKNTVLSAMFIAIGLVLPFLTGQIREIGNMLLPMHIPVFLCGLICGWQYGLAVGFIVPLLRSVLFSMPVMYPSAISMAFELATYGFVAGFLYAHAKPQGIKALYASILVAMLSGRVIWGIAQVILLGMGGKAFTWAAFVAGGFTNALPGIIVQLVLLPIIMATLNKAKLVQYKK